MWYLIHTQEHYDYEKSKSILSMYNSLFSSLEKCEEARDKIPRNSISQPFVSAALGLGNHPLSCNWISHYATDDVLSL